MAEVGMWNTTPQPPPKFRDYEFTKPPVGKTEPGLLAF